jgi:hypothetical protein
MKAQRGRSGILYLLITSELNGCESSASRLSRFTLGEIAITTHWKGSWVGVELIWKFWRRGTFLPLPKMKPRSLVTLPDTLVRFLFVKISDRQWNLIHRTFSNVTDVKPAVTKILYESILHALWRRNTEQVGVAVRLYSLIQIRTSSITSVVLAEDFRDFPQSLNANNEVINCNHITIVVPKFFSSMERMKATSIRKYFAQI